MASLANKIAEEARAYEVSTLFSMCSVSKAPFLDHS